MGRYTPCRNCGHMEMVHDGFGCHGIHQRWGYDSEWPDEYPCQCQDFMPWPMPETTL